MKKKFIFWIKQKETLLKLQVTLHGVQYGMCNTWSMILLPAILKQKYEGIWSLISQP